MSGVFGNIPPLGTPAVWKAMRSMNETLITATAIIDHHLESNGYLL